MGTGIVLSGQAIRLPDLDITNFLDDAKLTLALGDVRMRTPHERAFVHLIVMHSTLGIPGGSDPRPQTILPGFGPSTNGGERIVGSWTNDPARPGGAHFIVDFDGRIYCCADLAFQAAYHAQLANGCSVGIVGHRDLTASRGEGDPGDAIMEALAKAGCERLDFANHEDIAVWKERQSQLGMSDPDGIPGPMTVAALRQSGHRDGIWKS